VLTGPGPAASPGAGAFLMGRLPPWVPREREVAKWYRASRATPADDTLHEGRFGTRPLSPPSVIPMCRIQDDVGALGLCCKA